MKTSEPATSEAEVPAFAQLQRQIHDALRKQHPEWVQPDGESPTCDLYEARFADLLRLRLTKQNGRQKT